MQTAKMSQSTVSGSLFFCQLRCPERFFRMPGVCLSVEVFQTSPIGREPTQDSLERFRLLAGLGTPCCLLVEQEKQQNEEGSLGTSAAEDGWVGLHLVYNQIYTFSGKLNCSCHTPL